MPATKYSALTALSGIFFALCLLPTPVNSYDCAALANTNTCDPGLPGPQSSYPECLVQQFGASAFIECASQKGAPKFAGKDDDGPTTVSALDVLTSVLSMPSCDGCPLAQNIMSVKENTAPSPDFVNFGKNLCQKINPTDAGMCCLQKQCLDGTREHSIHAFCEGNVDDLMNAPLLSSSCVSNFVAVDDGSGDSDSSGGDSGSSDDDPSTAAASSSSSSDVSTTKASSPSSDPTPVATSAITPPVANSATTTSATSTSPTPQATPTANTGAVSVRRATFVDLLKRLGVGLLALLAAF